MTAMMLVIRQATANIDGIITEHTEQSLMPERVYSELTYFETMNKQDFTLVGFFDSQTCPECDHQFRKLFRGLASLDIVLDHSVKLMLVDFLHIPYLKTHYGFEKDPNLIFFVKNQMSVFKEFTEFMEKAVESEKAEKVLFDRCQFFVHNRIGQIAKHIYSLTNFNSIVKEKKIIGVFIGEKEAELKAFIRFAAIHPDFSFYYIIDDTLASELFAQYQKPRASKNSVFAVVRDQAVLDEFDTDPFVITDGLDSTSTLARFFDFERFPKLRSENLVHSITFNLFSNQEKILLYVGYDSSKTKNFEEFRRAVKVLPKRLVYTYTFANTQGMGYYMHLFMMAGLTVTVETVYIIHILPSRKIEVITMSKSLTKENIVNFVFEFYENQKSNIRDDSGSDTDSIGIKNYNSFKTSDL